jgi:hypothetical protein
LAPTGFQGEDRELTDCTGLAFRLKSDLGLVSFKKTLMPVSSFLRMLAVDHGLANSEMKSHLISPKYHATSDLWLQTCLSLDLNKLFKAGQNFVAQIRLGCFQDGSEPVPVSFRYTVAPLASMKTFVFKPSPPDGGGSGAESVRAAALSCHYAGNYQKVIRNKTASLIWEAACGVEFLDNKVAGFRKKISNLVMPDMPGTLPLDSPRWNSRRRQQKSRF